MFEKKDEEEGEEKVDKEENNNEKTRNDREKSPKKDAQPAPAPKDNNQWEKKPPRKDSKDRDYKTPDSTKPKPAFVVLREAKQEFDFDAMEENMAEFENQKKAEEGDKNNKGAYNFDDFFDTIGTS